MEVKVLMKLGRRGPGPVGKVNSIIREAFTLTVPENDCQFGNISSSGWNLIPSRGVGI